MFDWEGGLLQAFVVDIWEMAGGRLCLVWLLIWEWVCMFYMVMDARGHDMGEMWMI